MAIFNSILFHRARKSVGNVTLYALKEQNVVRAKGIYRRDRKSLAQLKQRARMKAVREVGSHFYHVLPQGFCCSSLTEGLYCFVKANVGKIFVDDELKVSYDLLKLEISGGTLMPPVLSAKLEAGENRVVFRWERQRLMPYAFGDALRGGFANGRSGWGGHSIGNSGCIRGVELGFTRGLGCLRCRGTWFCHE